MTTSTSYTMVETSTIHPAYWHRQSPIIYVPPIEPVFQEVSEQGGGSTEPDELCKVMAPWIK